MKKTLVSLVAAGMMWGTLPATASPAGNHNTVIQSRAGQTGPSAAVSPSSVEAQPAPGTNQSGDPTTSSAGSPGTHSNPGTVERYSVAGPDASNATMPGDQRRNASNFSGIAYALGALCLVGLAGYLVMGQGRVTGPNPGNRLVTR